MYNIEFNPRLNHLSTQQKMLALKTALKKLTPTQRNYWLCYYVKKQTTTEIAHTYGVNKSTVSRTIHRANSKIQDMVDNLIVVPVEP